MRISLRGSFHRQEISASYKNVFKSEIRFFLKLQEHLKRTIKRPISHQSLVRLLALAVSVINLVSAIYLVIEFASFHSIF